MALFLRCISRPLLATVVMVALLRGLFPAYSPSMSVTQAAALLGAAVITGAVVYLAALAVLWALAGRPESAERVALEHVRGLISARRSDADGHAL
jgi:hypothetical protein